MQNRYVGDIGDYLKLSILRALLPGYRLGVAWRLFPDKAHNGFGPSVIETVLTSGVTWTRNCLSPQAACTSAFLDKVRHAVRKCIHLDEEGEGDAYHRSR